MKKMNFLVYICLLGLFNKGLYAYASQFEQYEKIAWLSEKMPDFNYVESIVILPVSAAEDMIKTVQYSYHWFDDGITRTQRTITPVGKNQIRVLTQTWTTAQPQSYVTAKNTAIGAVVAGIALSTGYVGFKAYQYLTTPFAEQRKKVEQEDQDDQEVVVDVAVDGARDLATEENQAEEDKVQDLRQAQSEKVIQSAKWGKSFLPTFVYKIVYNEYSDEERAAAQAQGQEIPDESTWYKNADQAVVEVSSSDLNVASESSSVGNEQDQSQNNQGISWENQDWMSVPAGSMNGAEKARIEQNCLNVSLGKLPEAMPSAVVEIEQHEVNQLAQDAWQLDSVIDDILIRYDRENELRDLEDAIKIEQKIQELEQLSNAIEFEYDKNDLAAQVYDSLQNNQVLSEQSRNHQIMILESLQDPHLTQEEFEGMAQDALDW